MQREEVGGERSGRGEWPPLSVFEPSRKRTRLRACRAANGATLSALLVCACFLALHVALFPLDTYITALQVTRAFSSLVGDAARIACFAFSSSNFE